MHHQTHASVSGASPVPCFTRTLRRLATGALGILALATTIAPAQANGLQLKDYDLDWFGSNGYYVLGHVTANVNTPSSTITQDDIWDMSVSLYGSGGYIGTWTEVEGGEKIFQDLALSFNRDTLSVNQWPVNIGTYNTTTPWAFRLFDDEGLVLYMPSRGYISWGGPLTISEVPPIDWPPIDEPPIDPPFPPTDEPPTNTAPTLSFPTQTIVAEATGPWGAQVFFDVTASDAEDAVAPAVTVMPPSGSTFALGDTTVNVSATDSGELTSTGSFVVQVQDTTGPEISIYGGECAQTINVALGSGFEDPGASAYDAVDQWVKVCSSGRVDANTVGSYTITYHAQDSHGNAAAPVTRTINVVDPMPLLAKRRFDGGNYDGQASFNVTPQNNITGVVNVAGHKYRAAFPLQLTGNHQVVTFRGEKGASVSADLTLSVDPSGDAMFVVQTAGVVLELHPAMYSAKKPASNEVAGRYTAVFRGDHYGVEGVSPVDHTQGPIGSGFATFTVAKDGHVTFVGRTAEGTAMTGSSYLIKPTCASRDDRPLYAAAASTESTPDESTTTTASSTEFPAPSEFHVYSGLYSAARRGFMSGTFAIDRSSDQGSLGGEFRWVAPAGALVLYPHGIDTWGSVFGGRYTPATPEGVLGLRFSFETQDSYVVTGALPEGQGVMSTEALSRPVALRCRYTPSSGVLSGRGIGARSFQVIWLQEQGVLEGLNTDGNRTLPGRVETEQVELPL